MDRILVLIERLTALLTPKRTHLSSPCSDDRLTTVEDGWVTEWVPRRTWKLPTEDSSVP